MTPLYHYIKEKNVTQNALSQMTGIKISRINDLCNNDRAIIDAEEFYKIYKSLGLTSQELSEYLFTKDELYINEANLNEQNNEILSNFGIWIKSKTIKQTDICTATGIKTPRFSKLVKDEKTVLTGLEFIKICKYLRYDTDNEFDILFNKY